MFKRRNNYSNKIQAVERRTAESRNYITQAQLNTQIKGGRFRPSLMPTQFTTNPWCNITVRIMQNTANHYFTTVDIAKQLIAQFGIASSTLELRIISVSAWAFKANQITIWPTDFLSTSNAQELAVCNSMAQKNMYACVGYKYPMNHANHVFFVKPDDSKGSTVCVAEVSSGDYETHFKVLFRGGVPTSTVLRYVVEEKQRPCTSINPEDKQLIHKSEVAIDDIINDIKTGNKKGVIIKKLKNTLTLLRLVEDDLPDHESDDSYIELEEETEVG